MCVNSEAWDVGVSQAGAVCQLHDATDQTHGLNDVTDQTHVLLLLLVLQTRGRWDVHVMLLVWRRERGLGHQTHLHYTLQTVGARVSVYACVCVCEYV